MADQPYGYIPSPIIDSLELSVRASNVLRNWGGVNTLEDFMALNKATVMALPGAGVRTWEEIKQYQDHLRGDFASMFQPEAPGPVRDCDVRCEGGAISGTVSVIFGGPRPVLARDMTLRDWFAGQALVGFLSGQNQGTTFETDARDAYRVADAFIAAREAKSDA